MGNEKRQRMFITGYEQHSAFSLILGFFIIENAEHRTQERTSPLYKGRN
jgi:hypothetical protein